MLGIIVVLSIVVLVAIVCLAWICIKLSSDRLDAASLERFANGYLNQMGDAYLNGYNQRVTADMVPPTGPRLGAVTDPTDWEALEESEPHISESETEEIT